MTRPTTTEIPSDMVDAWLQDFRALPPVPPRVGWWRRVFGWLLGRQSEGETK